MPRPRLEGCGGDWNEHTGGPHGSRSGPVAREHRKRWLDRGCARMRVDAVVEATAENQQKTCATGARRCPGRFAPPGQGWPGLQRGWHGLPACAKCGLGPNGPGPLSFSTPRQRQRAPCGARGVVRDVGRISRLRSPVGSIRSHRGSSRWRFRSTGGSGRPPRGGAPRRCAGSRTPRARGRP